MYRKLKMILLGLGWMGFVDVYASNHGNLPYGFQAHPLVPIHHIFPDFTPSEFPKPKEPTAITLYVTSDKELKIKAGKRILEALGYKVSSCHGIKTQSNVAEQPIGQDNGFLGARNRIKSLEITIADKRVENPTSMIISIENFIQEIQPGIIEGCGEVCVDIAAIVLKDPAGNFYHFLSDGVLAPIEAYRKAEKHNGENKDPTGFSRVVAEFLKDQDPQIEVANWHPLFTNPSRSREDIIVEPFLRP